MVTDSQVQAGTERDEQGCGSRLLYTGRDERGRQGTAGDRYSTAPDRKAGGSIPSRRTTSPYSEQGVKALCIELRTPPGHSGVKDSDSRSINHGPDAPRRAPPRPPAASSHVYSSNVVWTESWPRRSDTYFCVQPILRQQRRMSVAQGATANLPKTELLMPVGRAANE
jgi:hypothetical protein